MIKVATILISAGFARSFQPTATLPRARCDASSALFATRREIVSAVSASVVAFTVTAIGDSASAAPAIQDSLPIEEFLRTGLDPSGPMGISAQAGKSRPITGVVFRDGTDVLQGKGGDVSAELLVGTKANPTSVLVSFNAPYKLETGSVFDVECRDRNTGDGAFVAVTESVRGKSLEELPSSFFLARLFDPTGRFSFYGPPTDVKVKSSKMVDDRRIIELSFSNLSQSTNAEIPRNAILVASIPKGTDNAIMLISSATASRWKKGADVTSRAIVDSFRAIPAPKTSMKLRSKDRSGGSSIDF
ncbi:hypothetical protein ACHAW6_000639 [Cyclotella cf. meneghiniana]